MKLSAILLSVTLPVAASTAAYSAEPAKGGSTADWLKQNLASLDGKQQQKKTATKPRKGAFSHPIADASGGLRAAPALKMLPFVANRKLPSQRELDMQLISQTAKMASSQQMPALTSQTAMMATAPQPLAGNVSEVYSMMPYGSSSAGNVATYGAVGYVPQRSSRVVPGQVPAVQNQIRQFHSGKRTRYIAPAPVPTLGDVDAMSAPMSMAPSPPPMQMMMQSSLPSPGQLLGQQQSMPMQMQMAPQQQAQRFNAPLLVPMQAPPFTPDEQAILDRMSPMQSGNSGADSASSAGPAPFPLSLLPQDSLKQVISGSRSHRSDAPPSYFGCWHGAPQTASLPSSGFHTYTGGGSSTYGNHYSHYSAHNSGGGPLAAHQAPHLRAKSAGETTHALGQLRRLPPQDVKVAAYSAYPRISGSGY
jgi:hypothetical protein